MRINDHALPVPANALSVLGDRLGLYAALARVGPVSPSQLAWATHLDESFVRAWLDDQLASRSITQDPASGTYWMTPEQRIRQRQDRRISCRCVPPTRRTAEPIE